MADQKPQIEGLPPGAELKPIEGLPPGAELRPVGGAGDTLPPPPDERNFLQKALEKGQNYFDTLTNVTPEQDAHTPAFLRPLAHFGAGTIEAASPFVNPLK